MMTASDIRNRLSHAIDKLKLGAVHYWTLLDRVSETIDQIRMRDAEIERLTLRVRELERRS